MRVSLTLCCPPTPICQPQTHPSPHAFALLWNPLGLHLPEALPSGNWLVLDNWRKAEKGIYFPALSDLPESSWPQPTTPSRAPAILVF